MSSIYKVELFKLSLVILLAGSIGAQIGHLWLCLFVGVVFYTLNMLLYLRRFQAWLSDGASDKKFVLHNFWLTITHQVYQLIARFRAENTRLKEEKENFVDSFQALSDGVIILDANNRIQWCNEACEKLLGIYLNKDRYRAITHIIRAPIFVDYLDKSNFSKALSIISPRSNEITLEVQLTTFNVNSLLLFIRDVSEIVYLETMRKDFIANVSHEMRTPLTVIKGYLETLKDFPEEVPTSWHKAIEQMLDQSNRIDSMVEDLIWLSRLESVPVDKSQQDKIDLYELISSISSDVLIASNKAQINLLINKGDTLLGNYDELRSAFTNLLSNAIKYCDENCKIDIGLNIGKRTAGIYFSDNGVGIDAVHIPRLTERFYRVDSSRVSTTGGTGLGLSIVKHILSRHKGRLRIVSKLGQGSQFTCLFPKDRYTPAATTD